MESDISARIIVRGMTEGWFAGHKVGRHKFARHLPVKAVANIKRFVARRRIINTIDRAEKVAGFALSFQAALLARRRNVGADDQPARLRSYTASDA